MGRMTGKVVLVTGAARGMGRSHAIRLAEEGADLILVDICSSIDGIGYAMSSAEDLASTVKEVEALGRRVHAARVDVRDRQLMQDVVGTGVERLGHLDGAVSNAGVLTCGTWESTTDKDWRTVLDVNLIGTWNTCLASIPHMLERGGSLVNISSAAGIKGTPLHLPYTASKHGVVGLSMALANELANHAIRVNTVHPTGVETGIEAPRLMEMLSGERQDLGPIFQNAMPTFYIDAVDVSNAVLYLLSDEARFVTGTQLKVDAGVTIR
ncbi:mycofactocin-coupled SDR family oxidoreductase [Mycobacterium seoulense]|uniref:3-ketoacyl-ACP reductase n=1 Tax=Mycobacterium seoulense TaxID=386911 RepID=A0A7I7P0R1_9MYCO|nr:MULTISPECIES: mycofactocin-coupled SDR family oxidoreductase [Mycobacterium]MCV7437503.1 mycofactocin-coupled SDR family oxidoreductase [Mycobacterium seoulense]OBH09111.1 3-ketoacyl-ACP reductase [Mycobacterium sp. E3247]OBH29133.1 3-ketoacyl-ACP reductase [Mycobacterium sp. E342]BBY02491.1 3-ketoacyl-ACP reductase [Mycobacterium seoulense]